MTKLRILIILAVMASTFTAARAQDVPYQFHWQPSPIGESGGIVRPAASFYEVFLLRGADGEAMVATVEDTIWVLDALPGVVQRISVRGVDASGRASEFSPWSDPVYFESNGGEGAIPAAPLLAANYPNPFNPETRIVYGMPDGIGAGDQVRLEIYTVAGQRVRSFDVDTSAGWHEAVWDGKDDRGQAAATGMYVTRFVVGSMVRTGKMTMIK